MIKRNLLEVDDSNVANKGLIIRIAIRNINRNVFQATRRIPFGEKIGRVSDKEDVILVKARVIFL